MKATLYRIEGPWPGRLAILPRPRGGDWLEDEIKAWKAAGIDLVLSALEPDEMAELDLPSEGELCQAHGIEWINLPIADCGVPASMAEAVDVVHRVESRLAEGKGVGIHCRQGVGRSALLAACLLVQTGLTTEAAFQRIAVARGCPVPDTPEQRGWVDKFARAQKTAPVP